MKRLPLMLFLIILTMVLLYPYAYAIVNSLKDGRDFANNPLGLPRRVSVSTYVEAWREGNFGVFMLNSIKIAVPTVAFILIFATLGGFAFAFFQFPGKSALYLFVVAGLAIPFHQIIIPLFFQMRELGLLNTYWAVIIPQTGIILPFAVLLLRSFMIEIPSTIIDAARIDGCTSAQLLWHVVVPNSGPALSALGIFSFMWTWNELFLPMVMLTQGDLRTIPVGLTYFQGQYGTSIPTLAAGAVTASLPVVLVYFLLQRHFVMGITAGAVKG